jgi:hypothetical protein
MTLDRLIQDRADTTEITGKNPTSTVSNDLLNLMATQQLKSEHEQKLLALQAAQTVDPRTVREQMEEQVAGMTLGELTNNTGKALNMRRQNQGKQPMPQQRGIAQAQQPQQQMPNPTQMPQPPMGGLPSAAPAGMVPKMASGGIVGFNTGGTPSSNPRAARAQQAQAQRQQAANSPQALQDEIQRLMDIAKNSRSQAAQSQAKAKIQELQDKLLDMKLAEDPNSIQAAQQARQQPGGLANLGNKKNMSNMFSSMQNEINTNPGSLLNAKPQTLSSSIKNDLTSDAPGSMVSQMMANNAGNTVDPDSTTNTNVVGGGPNTTDVAEQPDPNKIREAGKDMDTSVVSDRLDATEVDGEKSVLDTLKDQLKFSSDPQKSEQDEFNKTKGRYGIEELKSMQTAAQSDIAKAQKEYDSPEARAKRDVINYQLGGNRAMRQGQFERMGLDMARLRQKKEDMDKNSKAIYERVKAADAEAGKVMKNMLDHNRSVTDAFVTIAGFDAEAEAKFTRVKADIEKNAQSTILQQLQIESTEELQKYIQELDTKEKVSQMYFAYRQVRDQYRKDVFGSFMPDYETRLSRILGGKADKNETRAYGELEASINAVLGSETEPLDALFRAQLAKFGLFDPNLMPSFGFGGLGSGSKGKSGGIAGGQQAGGINRTNLNNSLGISGQAASYLTPSN